MEVLPIQCRCWSAATGHCQEVPYGPPGKAPLRRGEHSRKSTCESVSLQVIEMPRASGVHHLKLAGCPHSRRYCRPKTSAIPALAWRVTASPAAKWCGRLARFIRDGLDHAGICQPATRAYLLLTRRKTPAIPESKPLEIVYDFKRLFGGRTRTRTVDPLVKRQLLRIPSPVWTRANQGSCVPLQSTHHTHFDKVGS